MKIADTYEQPFPNTGLSEEDFVPVTDLLSKSIVIQDFKLFENDKGPGAYILFTFEKEKSLHYTTTHSLNIVGILSGEKVGAAIEGGETLECTVVKRASKKDPSKTVFTLE